MKTTLLKKGNWHFCHDDGGRGWGKDFYFLENVKTGFCDYPIFYELGRGVGYDRPESIPESIKKELTKIYSKDIEIKELWGELGDVPINEDDEIDVNFHLWEKGTCKLSIWDWFDEMYSGGVHRLLKLV
jgi:hypothetical protein